MSEFRFDRLVEIKEKLLEQKERELEAALAAQAAVIKEISRVETESAGVYDEMAARLLTGKELCMLTDRLSYLDMSKERLYNEKGEWERKTALIRSALRSLDMELKVLEKLKSRGLRAMKKARNRKEQKVMDELALRADGK
jgi:flagellar export protein FliJ